MRLVLFVCACIACGGQAKPDNRSWSARIQDAKRHERTAHEHERAATALDNVPSADRYVCSNPVEDQVTSGGQPVSTWQPCFDLADESALQHREVAMSERDLARKDRRSAAGLMETLRFACAGIPEREQGHSVFSHVRAIDAVAPVYNGQRHTGVRIVFKPVRGLTADWMRRDITCQRARWAAFGKDPKWMPADPTLIDDAAIDVREENGNIVVIVTSQKTEQAGLALSRARAQFDQTARR